MTCCEPREDLDLSAVIFVSGILINEKYIAINLARDQWRGNTYISAIRDALIDTALVDARFLARQSEVNEPAKAGWA